MLQALLALSLVVAFMPMLVKKMSRTGLDAQMNAAVSQINSVIPAARAFGKDNADRFMYGKTEYEGKDFADALEAYGLPIGFVPRTPFGQKVTMVVTKDELDTIAWIRMSGGGVRGIDKAEIALRLGFWAGEPDGDEIRGATGGWNIDMSAFSYKPMPGSVYVRVPLDGEFSDLLAVRARTPENNRMHVALNMGGRDIRGARDISAVEGRFRNILAGDMVLSGTEDGRRQRHRFGNMKIRRAVFQTKNMSNALNISRGSLSAKYVSAPSVSRYGDAGSLTGEVVSAHSFTMEEGRGGFTGPGIWDVQGNAVFHNITLSVERAEIAGFINAARGQDVFISEDGTDIINNKSGIETNVVAATAVTLRDQTSARLLAGGTGPIIADVRPAGVSVLPDAAIAGINNNDIKIIRYPLEASDVQTGCNDFIADNMYGLGVTYNRESLAQNIVCRFMFWQRLEQRINMKKCLLEGKEKC